MLRYFAWERHNADDPSGPSISTVAADGDGYVKGDVLIALPPALAESLEDYIKKMDTCSNTRKRDLFDCAVGISNGVVQQAAPGGPFAGLIMMPTQLPQVGIQGFAQALAKVIAAGRSIVEFATSPDVLTYVATVVLVLVLTVTVPGLFPSPNAPTPTEFMIPLSDITTLSSSSSSSACAPIDIAASCQNCGGDAGGNNCKGITKGDSIISQGCTCIREDVSPFTAFASNPQAYLDAQALFGNLPDLQDADFTCDNGAAPPDPDALMLPAEYCQCGANFASLYSTTAGANPCPYTTPPGPTITLSKWTAQSANGLTCSYPSSLGCAPSKAAGQKREAYLQATEAPDLEKRKLVGGNPKVQPPKNCKCFA